MWGCSSAEQLPPKVQSPHLYTFPVVQRRSDIQEKGRSWPLTSAGVKIDDIPHLHSAAIDNPIVAVERRRIAQEHLPTRADALLARFALEVDELHPAARLAPAAGLPLHDLGPGALVDGVVDWHDGLHIGGLGVVVLSRHRSEELGLGGIDPVSVGGFRDGGDFTRCGQRGRGRWCGGRGFGGGGEEA